MIERQSGITLIGGGDCTAAILAEALAVAPHLVAADGGADAALAMGHTPEAVIGDMDSVSAATLEVIPDAQVLEIEEQDSTDFDKAMRKVTAPILLAVGFTGRRSDHELAVFHTLVARADKPCIVIGSDDIVFHAPADLTLQLSEGTRVSLFPMDAVSGTSDGLRWPIEGLKFHPARKIGTSNIATSPEVRLQFDGAGMLVILPRAGLRAAVAALTQGV